MHKTDAVIPADIMAKINAMEDAKAGQKVRVFEPWEDKILLEQWYKKRQIDIAKLLNCSMGTCRKRYRELIDKESNNA